MPSFIGTGADQVPVNSMLGNLAYQDSSDVKFGNISYSGTLIGGTGVINIGSGQIYKDVSGNLGLGVTPSTWAAGYKAFEFGYNTLASGDNASVYLTLNGYYNAGWKYKNNGNSNLYSQINGGGHAWYIAPSGTAGNAITFTQAMMLDGSGNLGLGVTPNTWGAGTKALQFSSGYLMGSGSGALFYMGANNYYDGSNYRYVNTAAATQLAQVNGEFRFLTAPSGTAGNTATLTQVMTLDSVGNLTLSGTGATKVQEGTTAQRPASPQEGMIRKNSTTNSIEAYSGTGWVNIESGRFIGRTAYQSSGTFTFTPNSKTKFIIFEVVSAGGGTGGVTSTNASQAGVAIRGKNGKRVVGCIPYTETIASSYSIVVGAGGVGGSGSASIAEGGGPGGSSSITNNSTSSALVVAGGGVQSIYTQKPTVFVASWSDYSSPSVTIGSHYNVWSQPSTTNSLMVFNTSGAYLDLYEKVSPNGFFGLGGQAVVIAANDIDGNSGSTGNSGEVIIYEYS